MPTDRKFKITCKTAEEFTRIEADLLKLPASVLDQITEADNTGILGLTCIIGNNYQAKRDIYLPNSCRQISDFGDYIGCYCDGYFIKVMKSTGENTFTYLMLQK
jgi:hypothetical protein